MVTEAEEIVAFAGQHDGTIIHLVAVQRMGLQLLGRSELVHAAVNPNFFYLIFFSRDIFSTFHNFYIHTDHKWNFFGFVLAHLGAHQPGQVLDPHKVSYIAVLLIRRVEQVDVPIPLLTGETQRKDCGTFLRLEGVHVDGDVILPLEFSNLLQGHWKLNALEI